MCPILPLFRTLLFQVEGWNDVTLVYDGTTLTGIVENWKGYHKSSVNLSGI